MNMEVALEKQSKEKELTIENREHKIDSIYSAQYVIDIADGASTRVLKGVTLYEKLCKYTLGRNQCIPWTTFF